MPIISVPGGGSGGATLLVDATLGSSGGFDASAIPATASHLLIVCVLHSTRAAQNHSAAQIRFNNDSGANYNQVISEYSGAAFQAKTLGTTSGQIADGVPAANASASDFALVEIMVADYRAAVNKVAVATFGSFAVAGEVFTGTTTVQWASTAAINRIAIFDNNLLFSAGSRMTIYGLA